MPTHEHRTCASLRRLYRTPRPLLTPLMLAALGLAGAARAGDSPGPASPPDLLKRIEALEAANRALAGEVETLRREDGEAWLTEERAAEIRAIVGDVLADSETRNALQSTGMTAGWNDGFFLQSPDGRFKLEVGGLIQARYLYSYVPQGQSGVGLQPGTASSWIADNVENRFGFDLPNTQLEFKGHAFGPEFQYKVKAQFYSTGEAAVGQNPFGNLGSGSGDLTLLDAWVRAELSDEFAVRAGQFKLPFAREQLVDETNQLGVARSVIVDHLGLWYSQGVELQWTSTDFRAMGAFSDGGTDNVYGILKGAGSDPMNADYMSDGVDWAVTARLEWKLAGQWRQFASMTSPPGDEYAALVGVAANIQQGDPDVGTEPNPNQPNTWLDITADVSLMFGGASIYGAFFYSNMDSGSAYVLGANNFSPGPFYDIGTSTSIGAMLQASYYVQPKWEVFARFEWGEADVPNIGDVTTPFGADTLSNGNPLEILTIGLNWYIDGEDLKWSSDFGIAFDSVDGVWYDGENGWRASADPNEIVIRTMLQMAF